MKAGGEALLERAEKLLNEVRDSQQHPAPHDPPELTHDYLDSRVMAHLQDTLTLFGLWTDDRPPYELLEDTDLVGKWSGRQPHSWPYGCLRWNGPHVEHSAKERPGRKSFTAAGVASLRSAHQYRT